MQSFVYLGSLFTSNARSDKEIRRSIGIAKSTFTSMNIILTARNFSIAKWFYRRMLRISLNEKVTNVEVYRRMNTSTSLLIDIVHRQLTFLGHILRKGELENLVVTGFVDGKRDMGRQR